MCHIHVNVLLFRIKCSYSAIFTEAGIHVVTNLLFCCFATQYFCFVSFYIASINKLKCLKYTHHCFLFGLCMYSLNWFPLQQVLFIKQKCLIQDGKNWGMPWWIISAIISCAIKHNTNFIFLSCFKYTRLFAAYLALLILVEPLYITNLLYLCVFMWYLTSFYILWNICHYTFHRQTISHNQVQDE